jgi:energy-coupling factor transporter ATP-binding protein EcfA2
MITRAKFQNFKALRDVEITFDSRLTVLVGPNGSGKTSVLQGINVVCQIVGASEPHHHLPLTGFAGIGLPGMNLEIAGINRIADLPRCVSSGARLAEFRLECVTTSKVGSEVIAVIQTDKNVRHGEPLSTFLTASEAARNQRWQSDAAPADLRALFGGSVLLRLDPLQLAAPSVVVSKPPLMQPSGAGLPSTLAYIALNQPDDFATIVKGFRSVIPIVSRIRFDKEQAGGGYGDVIVFDFLGAANVNASFASSGTLSALGLLTSILGPTRPRVVLLDDLDHGLHPKAQMELISVLRKLLEQYPDLQIIATSHSPYILSKLEWNEVRVTGLKDDGSAICARLEDHPEVERWREAMTPGEFWSHAGDDWVKKLDKSQPATAAP